MRNHKTIIAQAGAERVRQVLGGKPSLHTVRSWQQRNGIPSQHWLALTLAGLTSLEELAQAAALPANDQTSEAEAA